MLTVRFVADGASELFLTLGGFPEAVGVQVHARPAGGLRGPAAEHGVTVVGPTVVDPILGTEQGL